MLYPKERINEFKGNLKLSLQEWGNSKIEALCNEHPRMKATSVYLKRGLNNWIESKDEQINKLVDNTLLFVADKNGEVNTDILIDDAIEMFRGMDKQQTKLGMFLLEYGKGEVSLTIPHNLMLDMIFGDLGKIRITAEDLLEIKELL